MTDTDDDFIPRKSKGQQKREAEAAQVLGTTLVDLPASQFNTLLDKLDLPEKLAEALQACRAIKAREARRRQLQYIGKLMRGLETAPIEQLLAQLQRSGQVATAQLHQLERWRERLLQEGEAAVASLLAEYPQADGAQVRRLIASANKEAAEQQPPRASRQLFRYLRALLDG